LPLYKWVRDLLEKTTFITKTKYENHYIVVYYNDNGTERFKKISFRATKKQLQNLIKKIKNEINYYEKKAERDKKVLKELSEDEKKEFLLAGTTGDKNE